MATNAPADTTMMRIVHDALRRDLRRARTTLAGVPRPDARQVAAIYGHLRWMTAFLEAHHRSEDTGLYPLVRRREPSAAALLDEMAQEHETIAAAAAALDEAVARDCPPAEAVAAIDGLCDVLLPHLRREEDEVMPVVSQAITDAEWHSLEQEHNLDGKSKRQLGIEGHWLIDDATAEDRARVLELVPALPRAVLVHGLGPSYRRRRRACWNPSRRRVQHEGSTSVVVDADVDSVWEVVRDPTRVGEWSHECLSGAWVGGSAEAIPGARFRGRNRQGLFRWGRLCEVVTAEPYELIWRTVPTKLYPDSTEWALRLTEEDGGTRIEQTFEVVRGTMLEPLYAVVLPAHRDRTDALQQDLRRIGDVAIEPRTPTGAVG